MLALPVIALSQQDSIASNIGTGKRWLSEAKEFFNNNKNDEAEAKLEGAIKIFERTLGKESLEYADVLHQKGRIWMARGNYDNSILYLEQALEIRLKLVGAEHLTVVASHNNLGNAYKLAGLYEKAIGSFDKMLSICLKLYGPEHAFVAISYNNLGATYEANGEYTLAVECLKKAIAIRLKLDGEKLEIADPYNNLGIVYDTKGEYFNAIEYYEKALSIRLKFLGEEHADVAQSYNNIGVTYESAGEYGKAVEYKTKALNLYQKLLGENHPNVAASYNNLGSTYNAMGEDQKAIEFYEKALGLRLKILGLEHLDVAQSYNNLGTIYSNSGEYEKAKEYNEKALNIYLKQLGEKHSDVATTYNNLGIIYEALENHSKSIEYLEKALSIRLSLFGKEHPDVAQTYNNLGITYNSKKEYDRAITFDEKALAVCLKLFGEEHPAVADFYSNLGNTYEMKGSYDNAIIYKEKALRIRLKVLGENHYSVAQSYVNLGISYDYKKEYDKAITCFSKALSTLKYNPQQLDQVKSLKELWRSLFFSALCLKKQPAFLKESLKYAQETLAAIDYQSSSFTSESSKTYWQSIYHPIYEHTIDISLLAADANQTDNLRRQTFTYAEKSKATQLQAQLKNADALAFSGIPDSLTQKEYRLRVDLTWREKQRQTLLDKGKTETDSTVLRLSSILFDLRRQYDALKSRIEKDFPKYYHLKYDLGTVPLQYVQDSLLQPGQTLLEYFVGDSSIYLFLVQPKNYEVIKIKKDTTFEHWVEDLTRNGIYGFYGKKGVSKGKSINNYGTSAYKLYETLIAPIKAKLPEKGKLIIIPDGILGYVPFEALLTEKPPRPDAIQEYKYLIQKHQISYCYSATLLKEMQNKKHRQEPTQTLLAMAPFFLGNADTLLSQVDSTEFMAGITLRDTLTALPNSGEEVARIQKILKGQAFYGKAATLVQFQKLAAQARILHLSTHAEADNRLGDYAYLAFSMPNANGTFDKLYVRDLYNLSLNSDLVALSACETGIGKLQRGEGIVSLARAFAYAGAKSIVTTLWKVSDEHSKNLMTSFYKYLGKGKEKDEALRLAKLDFLKVNEKRTELLHPFFWASFIGIGDMRGLENSK